MTNILSLTGEPPKLFAVTYCVEQGYTITVQAASPEDAERIVKQRLDDEMDVLDGSTRVHHAHLVYAAEGVCS